MLRTYDLISSITKRIKPNSSMQEDDMIYFTLSELERILKKVFNRPAVAEFMCNLGVAKKVNHDVTAKLFNSSIAEKLTKYLTH